MTQPLEETVHWVPASRCLLFWSEESVFGLFHTVGHRHDSIETRGVQKAHELGLIAGHGHSMLGFAREAYSTDESTQAGGIHERHLRQVDQQVSLLGEASQGLAEAPNGVCVQLTGRLDEGVVLVLFNTDFEHDGLHFDVVAGAMSTPHGTAMAGNLRTVTDVLLATDSDELFATIDSALASDDTNVYRVRRGQDVLPVVEQKDPDLVILDLQIGNMGGVAACIAIRQEEGMDRLAKRPVALLLDKSSDTYIAQQSRADGWLVKPLDPLRLRSLSSALLENGTLFEGLGS